MCNTDSRIVQLFKISWLHLVELMLIPATGNSYTAYLNV